MDQPDKASACELKIPYKTYAEAEAAKVYAGWLHGHEGSQLKIYRCRYCLRYHLARKALAE